MDGILTCARYAFAPNYYKYCGPDASQEIAAYIKEKSSDPGLVNYLSEFTVLYPYLNLIAHENGIADPFNPKVVEAYWIGNALLEKVGMKAFSEHLSYVQKLKKRLPQKKLKWIIETIPKGAKVHHSFHVFSIFTRTGHHEINHTLDTMDNCRIGWGKIVKIYTKKSKLKLMSQKLLYKEKKLNIIDGINREVRLPINGSLGENLQTGDWVSYHWGFVCDKINFRQVKQLEFYTKHNLKLANETI